MKIIDLLNKIANGEIPKKIKINDFEWEHDGIDYERKCDGDYLFSVFLQTTQHDLNMEVEILEEEKKIPEKLEILQFSDLIDMSNDEIMQVIKDQRFKINEIIDYLKSKGE